MAADSSGRQSGPKPGPSGPYLADRAGESELGRSRCDELAQRHEAPTVSGECHCLAWAHLLVEIAWLGPPSVCLFVFCKGLFCIAFMYRIVSYRIEFRRKDQHGLTNQMAGLGAKRIAFLWHVGVHFYGPQPANQVP